MNFYARFKFFWLTSVKKEDIRVESLKVEGFKG